MCNKITKTARQKNTLLHKTIIRAFVLMCVAMTLCTGTIFAFGDDTSLTSVTIFDGATCFSVETKGKTVEDALDCASVFVSEQDTVSKSLDSLICDGDVITVERSKKFYLENSGQTYEIITTKNTVGEALHADGFEIGKYDEVIPDVDTIITDGMTVRVMRVYVEVYEVTSPIAFTEKKVENNQLAEGQTKVIQEGKNGESTRYFKKITKDGGGVYTSLIGEKTTKEPTEKIIEVGTKKVSGVIPPTASQSGSVTAGKTADGVPYHAMPTMAQNNAITTIQNNVATTALGTFSYSKKISCKATAYEGSAASNGKWAGKTATGRAPIYGVIAVDPSVIPLNSKVYIESADGGKSWIYGFAVAGDTGGAIKGNRVDLCYNTLDQCYQFGRRDCVVYILN